MYMPRTALELFLYSADLFFGIINEYWHYIKKRKTTSKELEKYFW